MSGFIKYIFVLAGLFFSYKTVFAQRDSLIYSMDKHRFQNQQNAMLVLGTWSLGNIVSGVILKSQTQGSESYFHQMNALWNSVNLGIAAMGYLKTSKEQPTTDPMAAIEKQLQLEKSLLFNTGLDLAYITAGAWMIERSKNQINPQKNLQLRGYGKSLIVQGSFLFLFDACFYSISSRNSKDLQRAITLFYISPSGIGIQKTF
jgi:hypothetical protein